MRRVLPFSMSTFKKFGSFVAAVSLVFIAAIPGYAFATGSGQPTVTITSPTGGENLIVGQTYHIAWNSSSNVDKVSVGYSFGEGSLNWFANNDGYNIPNTNSYDWTVNIGNHTMPAQVRIYVIAYNTGTGSAYQYSNYFTVSSPATQPTLASYAATNITQTSATLSGAVNTDGGSPVTSEYFVYSGYGSGSVAVSPVSASPSANVTGLTCGQTYTYHLQATNAVGTANSTDQTFTTVSCTNTIASVGPTITMNPVGSITQTSATLSGSLVSLGTGGPATLGFKYGLTQNYGTTLTVSGNTHTPPETFSTQLTGLTCGTLYYYAGTITTSAGPLGDTGSGVVGPLSFTTLPCSTDTVCTPTSPQSITVLSPNGYETYVGGKQVTITWKSCNLSSTTPIYISLERTLSGNSTVGYAFPNRPIVGESTTQIYNTGSATFTMPNQSIWESFVAGDRAFKIHISTAGSPQTPQDYSDEYFSLSSPSTPICDAVTAPYITVVSPNGGQTFSAGQTIPVAWTSCNVPSSQRIAIGMNMNLPVSTTVTSQMTNAVTTNTGSYNYTLPASSLFYSGGLRSGNYYQIAVYAPGGIQDLSDAPVTINNSTTTTGDAIDKTYTIISGGKTRSYLIHVPATSTPIITRPVIIVFHGAGDTATNMRNYTGFSTLADANGYIVVYPESYISSWADGRNMAPEDAAGINDVQFTRDVMNDVASKYAVDKAHMYATGFSSGGYFSHKLACEATDLFKAFAPVGAGFPDTLTGNCAPQTARSLMFIEGSEDAGNGTTTSNVRIFSAETTMSKWSVINGCTDTAPLTGGTILSATHTVCKNGTRIAERIIQGAGHTWVRQTGFDTSATIMEFFQQEKNTLTGVTDTTGTTTTGTSIGAGCTSSSGYSITTGMSCSGYVNGTTNSTTYTTVINNTTTNTNGTNASATVGTGVGSRANLARLVIAKSLRYGQTDSEVKNLQAYLIARGYLTGTATGYYGSMTRAGVKKLQSDLGITSDGSNVGPTTRYALSNLK